MEISEFQREKKVGKRRMADWRAMVAGASEWR